MSKWIKSKFPWLFWNVKLSIANGFKWRVLKSKEWHPLHWWVILLAYEINHGDEYGQDMNQYRFKVTLFNIDFKIELIDRTFQPLWGIGIYKEQGIQAASFSKEVLDAINKPVVFKTEEEIEKMYPRGDSRIGFTKGL